MGRYPGPTRVAEVIVYSTVMGFRYTCRDKNGQIVFESPLPLRSRWDVRDVAKKRWPKAEVVFT